MAGPKNSGGEDSGASHVGESVSWFAGEFGVSRNTVNKKISESGLSPTGRRRGYPVYRIAELAPYLVQAKSSDWASVDPDNIHPMEQQAYWNAQKAKVQTEREKDRLLTERRMLLDYANVEYGIAALLRTLRESLLVMGDAIDAEAGLSHKQRAAVDKQVDVTLDNLRRAAEQITDDDDDDGDIPEG